MLSINTNLSSLIAQNSMKSSTDKLNQAIERMTTGVKINHAKDNAANYSIATNMTTKINAYQVAEDNCAMGLDMVTTASDSLDLISNHLSRLRSLAVQASNGTYGSKSLSAINSEATALINEIYRTKNTTTYNSIKVYGDSPIDEGTVGAKGLEVNEQGFLQEITKVDTSAMISLAEIDENQTLAVGSYTISSADELAKLSRMQNSGKVEDGSTFVLTADIDLSAYSSGEGWIPIGGGYNGYENRFNGTFDGQGHKITSLYINKTNKPCQGLFGSVHDATIKNIGIESGFINVNHNSGPLVGATYAATKVINCYSKIDVKSDYQSGCLIGIMDANTTVNYCYATGNINGRNALGGISGGGVGATVLNSFTTGNITGTGEYIGGLTGYGILKVDNCYSTGNIYGHDDCGGLVGCSKSTGNPEITNSHFTGKVTGLVDGVGGILGNCYIGVKAIKNCYATNDVIGSSVVGGIVGYLDIGNGVVENCHFVGKVYGEEKVGSIAGEDEVDTYIIKDCTSNAGNPVGLGKAILENVKDISSYTGLQIGTNGNASSRIEFETAFSLGNLRSIIYTGIEKEGTIDLLDNLINQVSELQTNYGAVQNRLESALEEIATQYDNLVSSRSTIQDADIAEVSSEYIRQQILQQASATLMATANQSPALALQLL